MPESTDNPLAALLDFGRCARMPRHQPWSVFISGVLQSNLHSLVRHTAKRARATRRDNRTKTTAAPSSTCPTISRPILHKIERNHSHSKHNFEGYILNNNLWPKVGGEAHPSSCLFFLIQTLAHVLVSQICANLISPLFLVNSFARILITCHVI